MADKIPLFEINPALDRQALARAFAGTERVQIKDVLTSRTADEVHRVLERGTPWGLAWRAGNEGPLHIRNRELGAMPMPRRAELARKAAEATAQGEYAFSYAQYPALDAYLGGWDPGSAHDLLIEHLNDTPFLDLVREITGVKALVKADAQATLYAPGQFLAVHDDSHVAEGWRIAYVLSLARDWRPDWGGYLNFLDEDGDVVAGLRPRFNALNLFAVPQRHHVTYVPPFAPIGRFSITGWVRDR